LYLFPSKYFFKKLIYRNILKKDETIELSTTMITEPLLLRQQNNFKVIRAPGSDITKRSPYREQVWIEWENQNPELTTNIIYPILKRFISGENILNGRIISEDIDTDLPYYTNSVE